MKLCNLIPSFPVNRSSVWRQQLLWFTVFFFSVASCVSVQQQTIRMVSNVLFSLFLSILVDTVKRLVNIHPHAIGLVAV